MTCERQYVATGATKLPEKKVKEEEQSWKNKYKKQYLIRELHWGCVLFTEQFEALRYLGGKNVFWQNHSEDTEPK